MTKGHRQKKQNNFDAQEAMIAAFLEKNGHVTQACKQAGVSRETFYRWKRTDKKFEQRLLEARQEFCDDLRAAALKRALSRSDVLLMFLLKSFDPETHDDAVRKLKYLAEKGIDDPDAQKPVQIVFVREAGPEDAPTEDPADNEPH